MAKFKELQLGQKVRVLDVSKSSADLGSVPSSTMGDVATITQINAQLKKWVRLDNGWCYKAKDLEIISEDVSETVRTEPVTTAKDVPVGTKVRVRDFKDAKFIKSPDRLYHPYMESSIGEVYTVQHVHSCGVLLSNGWNYCFDVVEPVVEQPVITTESSTSKVDASTPVGTKVRVLRDQEDGYYKAGAVGTLGRHDGDDRPRIDFLDDYWYPNYGNLEIIPQDTPDTVCKPELEPEPVAAPKELTLQDFVVTRVRVKSTGAKGTVIGFGSISDQPCVQYDQSQVHLHSGPTIRGGYTGAEKRCYIHNIDELEIITEEV